MKEKGDIFEFLEKVEQTGYEQIRLDENETALILFTSEMLKVDVHYCDDIDIRGYVQCNDDGCVLCKAGKKKMKMLLLPVYNPATGSIGILPLSTSLRPQMLLPQILSILKSNKPMVLFVKRKGNKYEVSTFDLKDDMDSGEETINKFLKEHNNGVQDLSTIYTRIDNEELRNVEGIARILKLKGK